MKTCSKCGGLNTDGEQPCYHCGAQFSEKEMEPWNNCSHRKSKPNPNYVAAPYSASMIVIESGFGATLIAILKNHPRIDLSAEFEGGFVKFCFTEIPSPIASQTNPSHQDRSESENSRTEP